MTRFRSGISRGPKPGTLLGSFPSLSEAERYGRAQARTGDFVNVQVRRSSQTVRRQRFVRFEVWADPIMFQRRRAKRRSQQRGQYGYEALDRLMRRSGL